MNETLCDRRHRVMRKLGFTLAERIGQGSTSYVYAVAEDRSYCVKLYTHKAGTGAAQLKAMCLREAGVLRLLEARNVTAPRLHPRCADADCASALLLVMQRGVHPSAGTWVNDPAALATIIAHATRALVAALSAGVAHPEPFYRHIVSLPGERWSFCDWAPTSDVSTDCAGGDTHCCEPAVTLRRWGATLRGVARRHGSTHVMQGEALEIMRTVCHNTASVSRSCTM